MKKNLTPKKRRLLFWMGIPILVLFGVVLFAVSGLNSFLKPKIKSALNKVVVDGSDSLYSLTIRDYTIGPGGRSAVINGIEVKVDSVKYKALKASGNLPPLVFSVLVEKLAISGLSPWQLWRNKNIYCNGIELAGLKLNLLQQTKSPDSLKNPSTKTLYELIKPDINNIDVGQITLKNADVLYRTVQEQTLERSWWHFKNTQATIEDILVDSISGRDTSRILYAGNFNLELGALTMTSSDGNYKLSTKNTSYDFKKRLATIEDFKLSPVESLQAFTRKTGYAKDQFTITVPSISFGSFNPSLLLTDSRIKAGDVRLENPDITIKKDNTAPVDKRSKVGKYPHQMLLKADLPISIRKIHITNGRLLVAQRSRKTGEEGSFRFRQVKGVIKNVTNEPGEISSDKWCRADLSADFMGGNLLKADFGFDLASANGHFVTDASINSLPPSDINPTFKALARAQLESFNLQKLRYHVEGYDGYALGDLQMLYRDLKLTVLEEEKDGDLKKKGLISFLANLLKIYDHNPMPGEPERKAMNIREQRIPEKNFFGFVIRTLLTCVQQIALKGDEKKLPGLSGNAKQQEEKKDDKKENKKDDKKKDKKKD